MEPVGVAVASGCGNPARYSDGVQEASVSTSRPTNQIVTRRDVLRAAAAVAASALPGSGAEAAVAQAPTGPSAAARFFPNFKPLTLKVSGATINAVMAGEGPPVLLLHGAPQSMISWRLVAPELANDYTVVVTDLRGYGDSSKPPDGDNHANYSKRAMALDQVEVMQQLGFQTLCRRRPRSRRQDRSSPCARSRQSRHPPRRARHCPDLLPYTHVTADFVQAYFHWFNYLRAAPAPENQLKEEIERQAGRMTSDVDAEYLRVRRDPANIHAMCEDYRAGASI